MSISREHTKEDEIEIRLLTNSLWVHRLVRTSKPCTLFEFKNELYKVLWTRAEGYESVAEIANELYMNSGICAIYFSRERGYDTFEEMVHSEELENVITIERIPWKPSYIIYHYRATLNNEGTFSDIRKRNQQKKKQNASFQDLNRKLAGLPTEAELRMSARTAAKRARKSKQICGEIISYEIDVGSDDDDELNELTEFIGDDGDEWTEGREDGDSSGGSVFAENISIVEKTNHHNEKRKRDNEKEYALKMGKCFSSDFYEL
ncbi:hypothetical protein niasHS_013467 [Heterodera schachtii]|uniref:DUF7515 domain-containing protein n=1 Tax=Heterodera schachtii TaxID=97005 RepID=A0ABD2IF37_HETSC